MPTFQPQAKQHFTLIELLVVVVIILILATMLMPVLDHARNAGYRAACVSNLKQLQTAHGLYTMDNDKWFMDPDNSGPRRWVKSGDNRSDLEDGVMMDYVRAHDVFYCEADETHLWRSYSITNTLGNPHEVDISPTDRRQDPVHLTPPVTRRNHVTESFSEVYTFIEESDPRGYNINAFYVRPSGLRIWANADWPAAYHVSGYNLAFLDGHVKMVKMEPYSIHLSLSAPTGSVVPDSNPDLQQLFDWQDAREPDP